MSSRRGSRFTEASVQQLCAESNRIPVQVPDFDVSGGHSLVAVDSLGLSERSRKLLEFFAPITDQVNFVGQPGHDPVIAKKYEVVKKLAACQAMALRLRKGPERLRIEATTAGVDLPTFVRQLLLVITRAYAKIFTPELFGVIPLTQPYGRIHFKDYLYDSAFTGSVPNVAVGDRTDDITKFNPAYYSAPEGQQANRIRYRYTSLDVTAQSKRVIGEWSDDFADDAASVYGDDAESVHLDHMAQEMARTVDRDMLTSVINNVPSANTSTFTQTPTLNPNYAALSPYDQQVYDQNVWRIGLLGVINKIQTTRKYGNDGYPNWCVCGTGAALALSKCSTFVALDATQREFTPQQGALRDFGTTKDSGIRFLVDVMLAQTVQNATGATDGANRFYFGRTPVGKNDVGHYWLPYVNLVPTKANYNPETGETMEGVRSRYAIAQPNTAVNANSSQLSEIYGMLEMI